MPRSTAHIPRLAALLLSLPSLAQAGAWTPKEGTAYHKYAANTFDSDSSFGQEQAGFEEFTDRNLTYYVEYGIRDDLAFIASIPYKSLTRTDNGFRTETSGFGDVDIGLRYNFDTDPVVFSAQLLFKAPYLYDEDEPLPLGNGQEDVEFRLQLGKSLGKRGYFNVEAGYRYRADAPADEYRYLLEYGGDVTERFYLRGKLDGIAAAGSSSAPPPQLGNPALPLEFDLGRLETTAGLRFGRNWAWELTAVTSVYGSNSLRGVNYQLALVYIN